jgi:TolB-like protein
MKCSASSSSSAPALSLALACALLGGCAGSAADARPAPAPRQDEQASAGAAASPGATAPHGARVALFPLDNLSGAPAPIERIKLALERTLRGRGLDVVSGDVVEAFLAARRIRYTGAISRDDAKAAGNDLGVDGVLMGAVELSGEDRLSMTLRLVSAKQDAAILWIDGATKVANDSPGLLGLGILTDQKAVEDVVLGRLARSLTAYLDGKGPSAPPCAAGGRFAPKIEYYSPLVGAGRSHSVVVLPFRNRTGNRNAGQLVGLQFVRQLASARGLAVLEPGVLRDLLLRFRIIMEGGVSLDDVRNILGALEADLVVTGTVFQYVDSRGGAIPQINFTAMMLDARNGEVVWASTSYNSGTDAVVFFDFGNLPTAQALGCRMVRTVVDGMLEKITQFPSVPTGR